MDYISEGSETHDIDRATAESLVESMLESLGPLRRVLLIPPDMTRYHSWSGELTQILYARLAVHSEVAILPATGTHAPMTAVEIATMYGDIPLDAFRVHHWRDDLVHMGDVPEEFVRELSEGRVAYPIPCLLDRTVVDGNWDCIFSIGQVVPHEVIGMANHNKNVLIGTGGHETINKTHFLGAVCDMEKIMGHARTPVRAVLNHMEQEFCSNLPIVYLLTCRGRDEAGKLVTRGLFAGDDAACFEDAAALSAKTNLNLLEAPLRKVVVRLEASEFKSVWLGNKAIYRTRMAMADDGELIVLAPGVKSFGEDSEIDTLIRSYGYRGTEATLRAVDNADDLANNLSAAAHLIHGSSEERFSITYCTPEAGSDGHLTREDFEGVGYCYEALESATARYEAETLREGFNRLADGTELFYISNPGLGLWALQERFATTE